MICFKEGKTIKKKLFAIVTVCCAFTLALMPVACGGSSSGSASSASSSENAKAKEFFEKAIGAGDQIGKIGLGYLHQKGEGVEASGAAAADWCNRALAIAGPDDEDAVKYANRMLEQLANKSQARNTLLSIMAIKNMNGVESTATCT